MSHKVQLSAFLNGRPTRASLCLDLILAAVKYDIVTPPMPDEGSENEQIEYLKKSIEFEREDKIVRLAQQEAQFMRQHNEDRRLVRICLIICIILVLFVCFFFGYDIANLDRGWIQARSASGGLLK